MADPNIYLTMTAAALAGVAMLVFATLSGWRGWLELKQRQFVVEHDVRSPAPPSATARIEIADLKERIRKLEAIAAGVDL